MIERVRRSYVAALGIIALLLIGVEGVSQYSLSTQREDARLINLAGRQRMLSQRLTKELLLFQDEKLEDPALISQLLDQWNQAHREITALSDSGASRVLLAQIDPVVTGISQSARSYLAEKQPSELQNVLREEPKFLALMEGLVGTYELEARSRLERQEWLQWSLLAMLLCALLMEFAFIFRPLANTVERSFLEVQEARVETEEALKKAQQAAKLKSEFLANMSHEIRTPMNAILGMSELLMAADLEGEPKDYARIIQNSAESLLTILNDILDISKIQAGEFRLQKLVFDLPTEVEEAAELQAVLAHDKGLELLVDIDFEVPQKVLGDPIRVRQILLNLMNNAVKFTDQGHILVQVSLDQEQVLFEVSDTGPGIPEEKFESLFRSFEQLDGSNTRKHQGTGLGLSIAASLVRLMDGKIGVRSELGEGSTFWFRVPFEVEGNGTDPKDEPLSGKRFLIVDDVAVNRRLLRDWIVHWGGRVKEAENGRQALDMLPDENFDFLLVDYQMPEIDGMEFARRAPKGVGRLVALPSIGEDQAGRFRDAGYHGLLRKPLRRRLLKHLLCSLIDESTEFASADRVDKKTERRALEFGSEACVLVVDDSRVNRLVTTKLLEKMGLQTESCESGMEALEVACDPRVQLVLMDCQMPRMDGYETTRLLRGKGVEKPIVALTANAMAEDRQRCLDAGMTDYLSKPLKQSELERVLRKYLELSSVDC